MCGICIEVGSQAGSRTVRTFRTVLDEATTSLSCTGSLCTRMMTVLSVATLLSLLFGGAQASMLIACDIQRGAAHSIDTFLTHEGGTLSPAYRVIDITHAAFDFCALPLYNSSAFPQPLVNPTNASYSTSPWVAFIRYWITESLILLCCYALH